LVDRKITTMPITIIPASHAPLPYPKIIPAKSQLNLIQNACPKDTSSKTQVLISSYESLQSSDNIVASSGSFVRGALEAWAHHLHLVLRPEDIWFAILVQLNFYMSANAEKLRTLFVSHEGKENIILETNDMNADSLKSLLGQFSSAIQERIKTEWMFEWIMPNFSTTTSDDKMTANVLMMGLMQHYFSYTACQTCGIPSVTLLGEREDWVKLLAKLDRLPEFGPDPTEFAARLRPILTRFVRTFDEPTSENTRHFWNRIVRADPQNESGSPPFTISGWLMGFCYWTASGEPKFEQPWRVKNPERLELDGVAYPILDITDVPIGYAKAPIKILDWPTHDELKDKKGVISGVIVAGALGKKITPGAPKGYEAGLDAVGRETILANGEATSSKKTRGPTVKDNEMSSPKLKGALSPEGKLSILSCLRTILPASWGRGSQAVNKGQGKHELDAQMEHQREQQPPRQEEFSMKTDDPWTKEEKALALQKSDGVLPLHEQGTLQPVSGWVLFGPEKEEERPDEEEEWAQFDGELEVVESYFRACPLRMDHQR
jgi:hypothetical protein